MTETPSPALLPDWDDMTDLDKGAALLHVWEREWEGAEHAMAESPCRYLRAPVLVALDPRAASEHAWAVTGGWDAISDKIGPAERTRLYDVALFHVQGKHRKRSRGRVGNPAFGAAVALGVAVVATLGLLAGGLGAGGGSDTPVALDPACHPDLGVALNPCAEVAKPGLPSPGQGGTPTPGVTPGLGEPGLGESGVPPVGGVAVPLPGQDAGQNGGSQARPPASKTPGATSEPTQPPSTSEPDPSTPPTSEPTPSQPSQTEGPLGQVLGGVGQVVGGALDVVD
jgi:hypothetical protein